MCYYYDDFADIWEESHPKARKQHKCIECRLPIFSGETYLSIKSLYDGSWTQDKLCSGCELYRNAISEKEIESGCKVHESYPPLGQLDETMYEGIYWYRRNRDGIHESEPRV